MKYIGFIMFTVMSNAAAQVILKHGMTVLGPLGFGSANPVMRVLQIAYSPWILLGLSLFVVSTASHLYVLSKVDVSFAVPFLSLAYVAIAIFAYFVFHEDVTAWRMAGIAFICVGTLLIVRGGDGRSAEARAEAEIPASELVR